MTHRFGLPLLVIMLLCACWVEAPGQAAPQTNPPPADPPTAKPASPTPPAVENAGPDAPVPDLGTLPKTPEKPSKTIPGRIGRKVKEVVPRCLDAIVHTCWAQPAAEGSSAGGTPAENAYLKDLEIADFYFKTKNYRGAAMRYRLALDEKPEAPEAAFKLAKSLDRLGDEDGARCAYQQFLRVASTAPFTSDAQKALVRLGRGDHPCAIAGGRAK